jgi:hypothetical protein
MRHLNAVGSIQRVIIDGIPMTFYLCSSGVHMYHGSVAIPVICDSSK